MGERNKRIADRKHPEKPDYFWCSYHQDYHHVSEFSKNRAKKYGIMAICQEANKISHNGRWKSMAIIIKRRPQNDLTVAIRRTRICSGVDIISGLSRGKIFTRRIRSSGCRRFVRRPLRSKKRSGIRIISPRKLSLAKINYPHGSSG